MIGSAWPAVLADVLMLLRTHLDCEVYDTAQPGGDTTLCVVVGAPGEAEDFAGSVRQAYATTGIAAPREETGTIACVILASSGDDDLGQLRDAAFTVLSDIADILRTHQVAGGGVVQRTEMSEARISQGMATTGAFVDLAFSITYIALI